MRASGRGGAARRRACPAGGRGSLVPGLRELGHVPRLQASRRRVCGRREGAGLVSQTYVFARNSPGAEYDRSLAWAALLLAATGLVMVYSSSIATAERSEEHTSELQSHSDLVCR